MALGVDRAFLDTASQMEHRSYGRWKTRIPGLIQSHHTRSLIQGTGDGSQLPHGQDAKDSDRERSASKKTVTMAPTSRYMTSRRLYTARRPLITAEQQISILKNPITQECPETVYTSRIANLQKDMEGMVSKQSDTYTTESTSIPRVIASSPSSSREDSLSLSDLRLSFHEEPDFSSVPSTSKNVKRSLSSPALDELNFTVPLSPKWSSTQHPFSHSYTPQTRTRVFDQDKDSLLKPVCSQSSNKDYSSRLKHMSTHQANYWACAIPSSLPPSPDRRSSSWNPAKEYQALLDYTYPLRPNMGNSWSSSESRSLLQTDPLLEDSGIELDRFCSSSSLSYMDQSFTGFRHARVGPIPDQRLSGLQGLNPRELSHSKSSDGRLSSSLYSSLDQVGLSVESLDGEGKQNFHHRKSGVFSTSRSAQTFIRSTRILPQPGSLGELDEEFLRLPEQLHELQDLSHHLRDITAQMTQPVSSSWESLHKQSASGAYSAAQVEQQATQEEEDGMDEMDHRSVSESPMQREKFSEQLKGLGARVQKISSELNKGSLREVEDIINHLSGTSLTEFERRTGTDQAGKNTKESLLQHIQAFCSNLEELIQWLYKVVEKMEVLSPPTVDIESVKASLADYKSFQRDIQAHQPLTASVLQTGEMLLCCMNSASPFLKETLTLIERQSHVLESHSEHLFSSILSAMDCLTEPSSQGNTERTS